MREVSPGFALGPGFGCSFTVRLGPNVNIDMSNSNAKAAKKCELVVPHWSAEGSRGKAGFSCAPCRPTGPSRPWQPRRPHIVKSPNHFQLRLAIGGPTFGGIPHRSWRDGAHTTQIQGSNMTLCTRTPEHPQPNTRATSGMGRDGCCLNGPDAALGVRSKVGGHVQWTTSEVTGRDVAMSAVMTS